MSPRYSTRCDEISDAERGRPSAGLVHFLQEGLAPPELKSGVRRDIKTFGSVPATRRTFIRPSTAVGTTLPEMESTISWKSAASTVPNRPQFDVKSLFQNKSSVPLACSPYTTSLGRRATANAGEACTSPHARTRNPALMSKKDAEMLIDQTTKTLFHLHDIEDVLSIFNELPPRFHSRVVDSLLSTAVESSDTDAQIAAYYFQCARLKGVCSAAAFKDGFYLTTAALRDIAVNCIDAPRRFAIMQKAAGLCAISRVPTVQGIFDSQVVTGPVTCDVQLETVVDAIRSTVKVGSCGDKDCRGVEWDRETRGGSDWEPDDCEDDDWWSTAPLPSEDGWDSF